MTKEWSLLNATKDDIVSTITNNDGIMSLVGGRKSGYHTDEWLLFNDFLPHTPTQLTQYEKYSVPTVFIIETDHIDYEIISWSQEEIDAEALRIANEALFLLTEANAELSYWTDKTPQDVTDIITAAPNTFVSFKQMIEKNAQSIRVISLFLKLMRDTGRLG